MGGSLEMDAFSSLGFRTFSYIYSVIHIGRSGNKPAKNGGWLKAFGNLPDGDLPVR